MTRIILARHGYSVTNASGCYTGQRDVPLTDIGRVQAELLADYLVGQEKIDAVYASDLSRAMDTARPTAMRLGLTVTPVPALRELSMGIFEGMRFEDVARDYPEVLRLCKIDPSHPYPSGESMVEMATRVIGAVTRLAKENEGKCILLVSHGGAARVVRCLAAGDAPENTQNYKNVANASVSIYLFEDGRLTAVRENITEHLYKGEGPTANPQLY